MIKIENVKFEKDKYCLNCNKIKENVKNLKFSVKDNDYGFTTIALCPKCRTELFNLLKKDIGEQND